MDEKLTHLEEELNKNLEQILSEKETLKTDKMNVRRSPFYYILLKNLFIFF